MINQDGGEHARGEIDSAEETARATRLRDATDDASTWPGIVRDLGERLDAASQLLGRVGARELAYLTALRAFGVDVVVVDPDLRVLVHPSNGGLGMLVPLGGVLTSVVRAEDQPALREAMRFACEDMTSHAVRVWAVAPPPVAQEHGGSPSDATPTWVSRVLVLVPEWSAVDALVTSVVVMAYPLAGVPQEVDRVLSGVRPGEPVVVPEVPAAVLVIESGRASLTSAPASDRQPAPSPVIERTAARPESLPAV